MTSKINNLLKDNNSKLFNINYDTMNIIFNYLSCKERLTLRLINKEIINYIIKSHIEDIYIKFYIDNLFNKLIKSDKLNDNFYNYISSDKLDIKIIELHKMYGFEISNDFTDNFNYLCEFKNIHTLKYYNYLYCNNYYWYTDFKYLNLNKFEKLKTLYLNNCSLYSSTISTLLNFKNLRIIIDYLFVHIFDLLEIIIQQHFYVKYLSILVILNEERNIFIQSLCNKYYLEGISLNYRYNDISPIDFSSFRQFENLHIIKFKNYFYNRNIIPNLKIFPKLDTLYFKNCLGNNDKIFNVIFQINQLKVLIIISYVNLLSVEIDFSCLSRLSELTKLSLADTRLLDDHFINFYNLNKLEELMLYECHQITDVGICDIFECSNLKSIIIYDNLNITNFGLLWNSNILYRLYLSRIPNMSVFLFIINCVEDHPTLKIFEYDYLYERKNFNDVFNTYKHSLNYEITNVPNDYTFFHNILSDKFKNIKFIDLATNNSMKNYRFDFKELDTDLQFYYY